MKRGSILLYMRCLDDVFGAKEGKWAVTVWDSNQLNYVPTAKMNDLG